MNMQALPILRRAIALALILTVVSACNMASQESQGDSQYASQSQAQIVGHPVGPLEGNTRLEYDHSFGFDHNAGANTVRVDITIKGEIPLTETNSAECPMVCKSDNGGMVNTMGYCRQVSGSGTVNIDGTADWTTGSKHCTCSLPDTIKVNIQGKSFHEWVTPGDYCQLESLALKVGETWNTAPKWQCTCNTPREAEQMHVQESLAGFAKWSNPDLEKKTMIFPVGCPADSSLQEGLLMFGHGSYEWIFHSGGDEGANRMDWGLGYADYGTVTPKPMRCRDGYWGPPLEDIEDPLQWFPLN